MLPPTWADDKNFHSAKLKQEWLPLASLASTLRLLFLLLADESLQAQLGSGWVQYSPTKKIHLNDEAGLETFNWTSYKSVQPALKRVKHLITSLRYFYSPEQIGQRNFIETGPNEIGLLQSLAWKRLSDRYTLHFRCFRRRDPVDSILDHNALRRTLPQLACRPKEDVGGGLLVNYFFAPHERVPLLRRQIDLAQIRFNLDLVGTASDDESQPCPSASQNQFSRARKCRSRLGTRSR